MTVTALIVAAGTGERLGGGVPKQYRRLGGKTMLAHAVDCFVRHPAVAEVRVVVGAGQEAMATEALGSSGRPPIHGGATRSESVQAGLAEIAGDAVLVHDAARPFCPPEVIDRVVAALEFHEGAAPALPVSDTLARAGEAVDRNGLVRIQTPQAARLDALRSAYAAWTGDPPTDESSVLRAAGMRVAFVQGSGELDKITTAEDCRRAEQWAAGAMFPRTGMGFDVHAFAGEGPIMLGGIAIPHERGLAGHSDADVALHAITDAILGAAGLGDIGEHFPPSDPRWRSAPSHLFLAHAVDLLRDRGAILDHLDCTIIAEAPKIGPHRDAIRNRIAEVAKWKVMQRAAVARSKDKLGKR